MLTVIKKTRSHHGITTESCIGDSCDGVWIRLTAPTSSEITQTADALDLPHDVLLAALDEDESSRLEVEEDYVLIILDVPHMDEDEGDALLYQTYPLSIIHTNNAIATVCLKDTVVLGRFERGGVREFSTVQRSRFTLQILREVAAYYLACLRRIDRMSTETEQRLQRSLRNEELIQMLSLGKSLVYFSTSLKANQTVLRRLLRLDLFKQYPEDQDVLEDVLIENEQAMEMADIYTNILNSTMDAYASVISNNLNVVMKVLTSAAIVMAVPTVIASLYGMNVQDIPLAETVGAFWSVVLISGVMSLLVGLWLKRRGMF